jgi:hypothetical protein
MRLFPRSEGFPSRARACRNLAQSPVSDDQLATLPSPAAPTASLRCPFCQSRTALDSNPATTNTRGLRSGDLVVCAECLAPTIVRRAKRSLEPRLTAPGASTLIDLRRHPDVRALVEALQRGDIPPSTPAVLRAPFSNAASRRRRELGDLVDLPSDQELPFTPPRPAIADRPDERWDIRVGVWMDLKAGTAVHMVARAYGVTIEFVEEVQQHGLFPSYYRIIRREDRVMVDDGSGVFVSWTSPPSDETPAIRSSAQSSSSVSLASASQEALA